MGNLRGRLLGRRVGTTMAGLLLSAAGVVIAPDVQAAEWTKHWSVGFKVSEYVPVDQQGGGFRLFSGGFRSSTPDRKVKLDNVPYGTLTLGRGIKKWQRTQMSLELEVSHISARVGDETIYLDHDASTRVPAPPGTPNAGQTYETGDETFESRRLGKVTMTPVFVNTLFHWSGKANPDRSDFYVGGGLGVVLAQFSESAEYRSFAGDHDGQDDVSVDNAFGMLVKTGANVRLSKNREWFMYFEGEFIATGFLTSQPQVAWSGVDYLAGSRTIDTNGDGSPDTTLPADFRLMDPGHVRMDGLSGGVGIRYRFGKKSAATPAASTPAESDSQPK